MELVKLDEDELAELTGVGAGFDFPPPLPQALNSKTTPKQMAELKIDD